MTKTTIGYAVAAKEFTYSVPQEFAGAVETVRVPAGRYAIEQIDSSDHAYIRLEGTSVYRGWFGTNTRIDETPEPRKVGAHIYVHALAIAINNGGKRFDADELSFELSDGFAVTPRGKSWFIRRAAAD